MTESKPKYVPLSEATRAKLSQYDALMGKRPDGEIAKAAGLDRRYVVVYRYYAGVPSYRRPLKGERVGGDGASKRRPAFRRSRLDEYRHIMGDVPDGRIAELAGCSREAVMRYRSRHDISPASRIARPPTEGTDEAVPSPGEPTAAPAVEAEAALSPHSEDLPPEVDDMLVSEPAMASVVVLDRSKPRQEQGHHSAIHGYLVTAQIDGDRRTFLVIGSDIARAARRALLLLAQISPGASILELSYHAELLA